MIEFDPPTAGLMRLRNIMAELGDLPKETGARAMRSIAEVWMTEMKRRTPKATGALRASGLVIGPTAVGDAWEVHMVFGGPAAPYAWFVHENLRAHHPFGQAKYVESVVVEHQRTIGVEFIAMVQGGAQAHTDLMEAA